MKRHQTRVKSQLRQKGLQATILRETGTTENDFGKSDDGEWEPVGSCYVVPDYNSGSSATQSHSMGGEVDVHSPQLTLPYDTDAKDGDRVRIDDTVFEIQTIVPYPTHKTASAVTVTGEV